MKLLTATALAVMVMAAMGCQTPPPPSVMAPPPPYVRKFMPGSDMLGIAPSTVVFNDTPTQAPASSAPQPIIVTGQGGGTTMATQVGSTTIVSQFGGGNSGTTMATQVGDTTVVSQFGGDSGIVPPRMDPINTGSQTPTVYTMPVYQP